MEKQLDELITEFMRKVQRLADSAQSININVNLYNANNRLDWSITVQQNGEDRLGFSKNKAFYGQEGRGTPES